MNTDALREEVIDLQLKLDQRDRRIAELEAQVERFRLLIDDWQEGEREGDALDWQGK